jgi:tetratricopeptide (TPR) repeat protein
MSRQYEKYAKKAIRLFNKKNYSEALKYFDIALNIKKDDPNMWCLKSLCLSEFGRTDEAIQLINYAIQLDPNNKNLYQHKGNILYKNNRLDEALRTYKCVIMIDPSDLYALALINIIYEKKGMHREQLEIIDKLLLNNPNNPDLLKAKQECLNKINETKKEKIFCIKCGQKIQLDNKFCMNCGTKI